MLTENTSLKNTTPAGDSNTSTEMVIGKINTYQRTFLIVTGSLLALLVVIAVAGTNDGQRLQSSAYEIAEGAVALADYQVDSVNLALTNIFDLDAVSESDDDYSDEGCINLGIPNGSYCCNYCNGFCSKCCSSCMGCRGECNKN